MNKEREGRGGGLTADRREAGREAAERIEAVEGKEAARERLRE